MTIKNDSYQIFLFGALNPEFKFEFDEKQKPFFQFFIFVFNFVKKQKL